MGMGGTIELVTGTVIKVFLTETKPPKEKRLIVVGESFDKLLFATVFINSELNLNVFHSPELQSLNVRLEAAGRNYLSHDSYVDCSKITARRKTDIEQIIAKDPARLLGRLSQADYQLLRNVIKAARTISPAKKKEFGLFL
jgi:hypothetical protein